MATQPACRRQLINKENRLNTILIASIDFFLKTDMTQTGAHVTSFYVHGRVHRDDGANFTKTALVLMCLCVISTQLHNARATAGPGQVEGISKSRLKRRRRFVCASCCLTATEQAKDPSRLERVTSSPLQSTFVQGLVL